MNCYRSLVMVALLASFGNVHADLVDHGSYTSDTVTRLDWLDVPLTQGQSFLDAQSNQYAASGWHVAAVHQVSNLLTQYIGLPSFISGSAPFDSAVRVAHLLGVNYSTNSPEGLAAFDDPTLPVQWQTAGFADLQQGQAALVAIEIVAQNANMAYGGRAAWFVESHYQADTTYEWGGVWMVRDTLAVPEPTTQATMLLGLAALSAAAGMKMRRRG